MASRNTNKTNASTPKISMKHLYILVISIILCMFGTVVNVQAKKFQTITVNGLETDLSIFSIFVAPKSPVTIKAKNKTKNLAFSFEQRKLENKSFGHWSFKAPVKPGLYELIGKNTADGSSIKINLFVLVPYSKMKNDKLEGYRIGQYPPAKTKKTVKYAIPQGFIRVDKENEDMLLTPHFKLSQFLCKQSPDYPKFLILKEKLLILLEDLLKKVRSEGYNIDTFGFISGYRTPFYNQMIKNVRYSRHIYGDAADIFIDSNGNGRMDDLNRDGTVNISDAKILYNIAVDLKKTGPFHKYQGGIGLYNSTPYHDGFIHVDTRGYPARW